MNMYTYCGNNSLNYTDPSGLILRDREPDDVITAIIFTEHGHVYGLVGNWSIEDVYGRFCAEPQEITTYNIDGMTVFVEENDGAVHLNNPYQNDSSLVSVWLDATTIAYYRDAIAGADPITEEAVAEEPPATESESSGYFNRFKKSFYANRLPGASAFSIWPIPTGPMIYVGSDKAMKAAEHSAYRRMWRKAKFHSRSRDFMYISGKRSGLLKFIRGAGNIIKVGTVFYTMHDVGNAIGSAVVALDEDGEVIESFIIWHNRLPPIPPFPGPWPRR